MMGGFVGGVGQVSGKIVLARARRGKGSSLIVYKDHVYLCKLCSRAIVVRVRNQHHLDAVLPGLDHKWSGADAITNDMICPFILAILVDELLIDRKKNGVCE